MTILPPPVHLARDSADASDETLGVVLHRHATARVPATLALQVVDGALVSSLALFAHAKPWTLLAIAGFCVAMHGVWSIADLRLDDTNAHSAESRSAESRSAESRSAESRWSWRALRVVATVAGLGGVFGFILTLFGFTLGTWIS